MKFFLVPVFFLSLSAFAGVMAEMEKDTAAAAAELAHVHPGTAASSEAMQKVSEMSQNALDNMLAAERINRHSEAVSLEQHLAQVQDRIASQDFKTFLAEILRKDGSALDKDIQVFKTRTALDASKASLQERVARLESLTSTGKSMANFQERLQGQAFKDSVIKLGEEQDVDGYIKGLQKELSLAVARNTARISETEANIRVAEVQVKEAESKAAEARANSKMSDNLINLIMARASDGFNTDVKLL